MKLTPLSFAALLLMPLAAFSADDVPKPVMVFILAGQSNMEGQAVVDLEGKDYNEGKGTLKTLLSDTAKAETFKHLRNAKGEWTVRDDVWVRYQREGAPLLSGPLGLGFSVYGDQHHFGPELQFGHVVGDHFENPVLLIKTAWGGKSLYQDFRPPSSGGEVGPYYKKVIAQVGEAIASLERDFPAFKGRGYELAALVWYHGWNDGVDARHAVPDYEQNLANLIKDVRRDLKSPKLPVVIGELTGPWVRAEGQWDALRKAQAAAAARDEFAGTVVFVETHDFVRKPENSPNPGHGHHEFGNAETYFLVGDALGKAMIELYARFPTQGARSGRRASQISKPIVAHAKDLTFSAVDHQRQTIYHSPQKPGFTSWVGAWSMPDGSLMVSFTQATGPAEGRPQAPQEVQHKLTWPPLGNPGYDMTGLDMRNIHLRSPDAGKTWQSVSNDAFKSCMNGVTNEAQTSLADGTILRGVFGFYLPYDKDLPQTGFLQRSSDGTKTWGNPEVPLDATKYSTWPRRIRMLRDGRVILLAGVTKAPGGSQTRQEFSKVVEPALLVSSDQGRTWKGPLAAIPAAQRGGWTEEFDVAELAGGDLLCIFRRADDAKRWQNTLKKSDNSWIAQKAGPSVLPHSGQPELLVTREGPILHVATSGIHWTSDAGRNWHKLDVPGTAYYPRSVQAQDGRIFVFGHVGGDDAYGKVDQSIVMDTFRLARHNISISDPKMLPADKLACERIPLGEADDYKPCIAQLPSGELLLTAFHQHKRNGDKVLEQTLLFRSSDGGRTWAGPQPLDLLGREPYLTVLKNGTIFITGHLLATDVRNKWGYTTGFLHRSTDGGRTWQSTRVESEQVKPKASNHTTRNVLELADSSLLLGVDFDGGDGPYFVWRSTDGGQTWDKSQKCEPKNFKSQYGFFGGETWLWQARSGKIWALVRVDSTELPIQDRPIRAGNDQADHFILFSSADSGKTFDRNRDFGDYGEMYMSLLRLHDKRLLLTFTVRDLHPPLGVRALVGDEADDGFTFDFAHDRLMLDIRTPIGKSQGGGFGPSEQLQDGTLVTSYSYRGEDDKTYLEVVRWKLPAAAQK